MRVHLLQIYYRWFTYEGHYFEFAHRYKFALSVWNDRSAHSVHLSILLFNGKRFIGMIPHFVLAISTPICSPVQRANLGQKFNFRLWPESQKYSRNLKYFLQVDGNPLRIFQRFLFFSPTFCFKYSGPTSVSFSFIFVLFKHKLVVIKLSVHWALK